GRGSRSCRTLDEQLPETASRRENSRHDIQKMLQFLTEKWGINLYKLPPNLFYPFYLNVNNKKGDFFEISLEKQEGWIEIFPPKSVKNQIQFVWRWGKEKSQNNLNKEIVGYCTSENEYRIVQKMRHDEKLIRSILDDVNYTSRKGTAEVENIFK
ncbi:MAG: hypothetical protein SOZ72_09985, partial [Treponema sp.]|nr:hypothetical protein [Treponema sp.]